MWAEEEAHASKSAEAERNALPLAEAERKVPRQAAGLQQCG